MASNNPFLLSTLHLVWLFLFLFSDNKSLVSAAREEDTELQHTHHGVPLSFLFPSSSCTLPPQGGNKNGSLEVVHKYGPCSKLKQPSSSSYHDMLRHDEARVRAIQSKLSKALHNKKNHNHQEEEEEVEILKKKGSSSDGTQLPANSGIPLGSGNYYVTVGLGNPKRDLSLVFDTGSDLTWTQCKPCVRACYSQKEPIFDPSLSSSYSNISCSSSQCSQLVSATGVRPACSPATRACIYGVRYGDGSFSAGYFAKDKLTVSPTDVFDDFLFGCGQNNQGLFRGFAGLLGLGRDTLSFVEQTAGKYRKIFSYCLPSSPSKIGYITFGARIGSSGDIKFTPFSSISRGTSFYGLDFAGITVAGINLKISASVFSSGTVIDSGTVITRLPPAAYGALRDEFRKKMSRYPKADPLSILDTCYNLKGYKVVFIPTISLSFGGGVDLKLDLAGILFVASEERVCLAFAANRHDDDVAIIGNQLQKTIEVVYDVAGEKIGFRPRACN